MTIVMGLDQHRAQITTEWIDTVTGELSRSRIAPAHREGVRRFLARFDGRELEVALEATTGWRFVVEELQRAGASRASGRAGGDRREAGAQEAREDRSRRRPAAARAGDGRSLAGVLGRARSHPRSTRACQVAPHAHRRARRVAAADSRGALPPRLPAPPRHWSADREGSRVAAKPRAAEPPRASR